MARRVALLGMMAAACLPATAALGAGPACLRDGEGGMDCAPVVMASADSPRVIDRPAEKRKAPKPKPARPKGVADPEGPALVLRGGDIFIADGPGFYDDFTSPYAAVGYRSPARAFGLKHSRLSLEGEAIYFSQNDDYDFGLGFIETTAWTLAGIGSLRWGWDWNFPVEPYAAAGVGFAYTHLSVEDGVANVDQGDIDFAYQGRAGVSARIARPVSLEAGYRYLGVQRPGPVDGTGGFGVHGLEAGVVWRF